MTRSRPETPESIAALLRLKQRVGRERARCERLARAYRESKDMLGLERAYVWETGRWKYRHPRCGFVELERRENLAAHVEHPQRAFHWVIVSIEKPDKD